MKQPLYVARNSAVRTLIAIPTYNERENITNLIADVLRCRALRPTS